MNDHLRASLNGVIRISALLALLLAAAATAPAARATIRQATTSAAAPTLIDADIANSTTWRRANSPYLVLKPIKVLSTAILTLEAGVEVQFLQGAGIQIEGGLNAQGSHTQPITFVGSGNTIQWEGLRVVQPAANVTLRAVAIKQALAALAIQPAPIAAVAAARVDLLESLLDNNVVGVSADFSGGAGTPHVTLRNNLLTNNAIGVKIDGLPSGSNLLKLSYNSFVLNGIGVKALNVTGLGPKAEHEWWGSANGPAIGDPTYCGNDPPPNPISAPPDIVCGPVDLTPWTTVPAGRIILPNDKNGTITSAIGSAALGDDVVVATSVVTLTIPAQTFAQAVDLVVAPRDETTPLPGQATNLSFEISAVANGLELHQFADAKKLIAQIHYVTADLAGADAQKLIVYAYDQSLDNWSYFDIKTTPDLSNGRVVAQLSHLSRLRVTAANFAKIFLPLIQP